ncbi:MAG: hypothetical protein WB820_01270 [Rhodoplanes sp.]
MTNAFFLSWSSNPSIIQYKPTKDKLRPVMQAPHTASVRNVSVIEIPLKDCVFIVMTDNQPAFCEVDHTSPGAYQLSPRRLTSRSTGKLIATRSRNGIRLARIKASQPPPAQKESRK